MTVVRSPRTGRRDRLAAAPLLRSIGVEEELLLVDEETLMPSPLAEAAIDTSARRQPLAMTSPAAPIQLEFEVKSEQIEIVCPPLLTAGQLSDAIVQGRRMADEAASAVGARAVPLATAPSRCDTHTVRKPRYERMRERFAYTLDNQLTCGFHVHVGVMSDEEGVAVLDRIRPWLPVLLALSANSPYWHGIDTSFASYRYQAWGRWPTAGPYDLFGTADAYREVVESALATGVCLDSGMIYFDARLSAHVPTIELRIADVCLLSEDAVTIAVIARALVERAVAEWHAGTPADAVSTNLLRLASWRASRYGVESELIHPASRRLVPARDAVAALLRHVDGTFSEASERELARRGVRAILRRGTGASLQRRAVGESGDLTRAVASALSAGPSVERIA